jgi:hypothetical protein
VASEIKRIEREFILKNLIESRVPLEVHLGAERLQSFIDRMDVRFIWVRLHDDVFPHDLQTITLFFRFRNNAMTFTTRVIELADDVAQLEQPDELFRDLSRSFERIKAPKGVSVSFLFKGQQVKLDYPDSEQYEPAEAPDFDPGFDVERISELLKAFRQKSCSFRSIPVRPT